MGIFKKLLPIIGTVAGGFIGGPAGAAIGGSLGSAVAGGDATSDAANAQVNAANQATQLQREMWLKQLEQQEPFRQAGLTAQNRLLDYLGLSPNTGQAGYGKYARDPTMADLEIDPGYAFRLDQGVKALDRSAAARGGLLSGGHLKGLQQFGQDMASQEYTNAFNRYNTNRQNQINPLQGFLNQSQSATNILGQAGQNYANMAGQGITSAGEARAAGIMGGYNTALNATRGLSDFYQNSGLQNAFNDYYAQSQPDVQSWIGG